MIMNMNVNINMNMIEVARGGVVGGPSDDFCEAASRIEGW